MGVPKNKVGHARTAKRAAGRRKVKPVTLVTCPNCQELMQMHRVCPACGHYSGREVIEIKEEQ